MGQWNNLTENTTVANSFYSEDANVLIYLTYIVMHKEFKSTYLTEIIRCK